MQAFEWANAKTADDAVKLLGDDAKRRAFADVAYDYAETARPLGGGQDLHTTLKAYISRPGRVVNLKTIPDLGKIVVDARGVTIGATATLTDVEMHADVLKMVPGLTEAIHSVATPQIRNVGTIGGNLCQRPRCWYFRLEEVRCLKRGGDTCYAKDSEASPGQNKYLAVFGTDAPCVITHPSDLGPLLVALDAVVTAAGPKGTREIPASAFFRMPTTADPQRETTLADDEIVTQVRVPASPKAARSTYVKFKERDSLDFAMASVAAALDLADDKTIRAARVVLGGVAQVPWVLPAVDAFLAGKKLDEATIAKAADMAIEGAKPLSQNAYKLPLTRTLVRRALAKFA